jgi:hypothetical protein
MRPAKERYPAELGYLSAPYLGGFVKKMEALKLGFDGYLLKLDPERVRELDPDADPAPTKRMEAAYISALQYMRMQILTVWDRGVMMYGDAISMPEESGPAAR